MKSLYKEQLLSLLKIAKESNEQDWLMLLVTFTHGLRVSETINLTRKNFSDGFLTVQRLKGSMKTTQPLLTSNNPLLDEKPAIEKHLATLGPKDKLFPISRFNAHYLMQVYGEKAELPKHLRHFHCLKHSCGLMAIKASGIEFVRQYLGHVSIASTGAYLRVSDAEASAAVQKAFNL